MTIESLVRGGGRSKLSFLKEHAFFFREKNGLSCCVYHVVCRQVPVSNGHHERRMLKCAWLYLGPNPGENSYMGGFTAWLITMVRKAPKDRVVGPLPNGRFMAYFHGGDPNYI